MTESSEKDKQNKDKIIATVIVIFLLFVFFKNSFSDQVDMSNQISEAESAQTENSESDLTSEQEEIRIFLQDEIGILFVKSYTANENIAKAGEEWADGIPLPYVIDAQIILESVLKELENINPPFGGEKVKEYFTQSIQFQLEGTKKIREALEEVPVNEDKATQGIETYNKAMLLSARTTEEINKLKEKFDLDL